MAPPKLDTQARKVPKQKRSQQTVSAILEAAAQVLVREGIAGLGTKEIARVAGVSVGSLYQYFPSKEAVVAALIEEQLGRDEAHIGAEFQAIEHLDYEAAVSALVATLCDYQLSLAPLLAELLPLLDRVQRQQLVSERVREFSVFTHAFLLHHLDSLDPALRDPARLEAAVQVQTLAARGVLNGLTLQEPERLRDPVLRQELARLLLGLRGSAGDRS